MIDPDVVRSLLQSQKIATLAELKEALGTSATMTVFRKLTGLGYRTSYSHRGKYYTLEDIPRFDERGLWSYGAVWFSRDGNLLATAQRFVEEADVGCTGSELQGLLSVEVKEPLLQLHRRRRVDREDIGGMYVYFSMEPSLRREQRLRRESRQAVLGMGDLTEQAELSPELKAAIILFFSLLDEQRRRLYAGLEAHKLGHGGDSKIGEFLGIDAHTVARGRRELFGEQVQRQRVRKKGGGRKPVEKNAPSDRTYCGSSQARQGRRPRAWSEMDTQDDQENCPTTMPAGHLDQRQDGGPLVERDGILVAGQSQDARIWEQEPATATSAQSAV